MDILSKLQNESHRFSKGQRAIAHYILESYDKAAFMTANTLGKVVGVSESTVVRFAVELGYDGYPTMQKALQEMVVNRLTSVQRIEAMGDRLGNQDIVSMVIQSDMEKLRQTAEIVSRKDFASAVDAVLGATICKNLLLCNRQCTDFYLLLLPGDKVFKTKDLSKQIGSSRLSFADGEYMQALLDITPGSLSILGLMNDRENRVQLLLDEDVLKGEYIGCHPCINTSSLRLKTADLMEKIIPAMGHEPKIVNLPAAEA
jgi:Ala-tRNA(Pro) deacylase